jgi:hypothetical protein
VNQNTYPHCDSTRFLHPLLASFLNNLRNCTLTFPIRQLVQKCSESPPPPQEQWMSDRAIAQAVSRRLPTAVAWVRYQVRSCGFVVTKVALRQVFYNYFGFPCLLSFHQLLPISQSSCHRRCTVSILTALLNNKIIHSSWITRFISFKGEKRPQNKSQPEENMGSQVF